MFKFFTCKMQLFITLTAFLFQFWIFYNYGISTYFFLLTLLYTIYLIAQIFVKRKLIWFNKILLSFAIVEFFLTFIPPFTFLNHYTENQYYTYRSEFKREQQCVLLQKLGIKKTINYPKYGYPPNSFKSVSTNEYTFIHYYDRFGYRNDDSILNKQYDYKICIIGDSFVEGFGTPQDSTISNLLHDIIVSNSDKPVLVYNAGIAGSNPIYTMNLFEQKLKHIKFDLIINCVFSNDINDIYVMNNEDCMPIREYVIAISHMSRIFIYNYDFVYKYNHLGKDVKEKLYQQLNRAIERFKINNSTSGFINVYLTSSSEIINKDDYFDNRINNTCKFDLNFKKIISDSVQLKQIKADELFWRKDQHLKPIGNNFVANQLYYFLRKNKYL